jgi:hypothetical protein
MGKVSHLCYSKIAGISFQTVPWDEMKEGDELELRREKDNKYDPNSIAIHFAQSKVGYINTELARDLLAPLMDEGTIVFARVVGLTGSAEKNRGCNIRIFSVETQSSVSATPLRAKAKTRTVFICSFFISCLHTDC